MAKALDTAAAFEIVEQMEDGLHTMRCLFHCVALMVESIDDPEASAFGTLAALGLREIEAASASRERLFRLTHPRREHFDTVGWPGDEGAAR